MKKLIDYDVKSILQEFQNQYQSQYDQLMIPGSEEFAISSTFSYVLSVLVNSMNKAALNRFIDTAQGEWLDAIASSFGLSRTQTAKMNAHFCVAAASLVAANSLPFSVAISGITYYRRYGWAPSGKTAQLIIYVANVPLNRSQLSNEALTEAIRAYVPDIYKDGIEAVGQEYPQSFVADDNGQPLTFPYTTEGDNSFREFIKLKAMNIPGTAKYYESLITELHPYIGRVHCVRQNETGYEKGYVNFYWTSSTEHTSTTFMDVSDPAVHIDLDDVYTWCAECLLDELTQIDNLQVLGAELKPHKTTALTIDPHIHATYKSTYYKQITGSQDWAPSVHSGQWSAAQAHYMLVYLFYASKIRTSKDPNEVYNTSELSAMLLKSVDEIDGMHDFAYSLKFYGSETALKQMYENAVGVRAELSYRVSLNNLNQPAGDLEFKADFMNHVSPRMTTSPATGNLRIENALVSYM